MLTHTIQYSYVASGQRTDVNTTTTSELETNFDVTVPDSSSAYAVSCSLDFSQCKSLFILADAALTLKVNSAGSPDQTISLGANAPIVWASANNTTCPVTADITQLFVSCSTAQVGGNLTFRSLADATV